MKFDVPRKKLLDCLVHCADVADKGTSTVTTSVHIAVVGGHIVMTSVAPPLSIRRRILDAAIGEAGSVMVSAAALRERVQAMPDGEVSVEHHDSRGLVVRAAGHGRRYELSDFGSVDAPRFPDRPKTKICEVEAAPLAQAMDRVAYAVDEQALETAYRGCYVDVRSDAVECAATTGSVISVRTQAATPVDTGKFFVSAGALRHVIALLSWAGKSTVEVYADHEEVHILTPEAELVYKLTSTKQMPIAEMIRSIVPETGSVFDRARLLDGFKAAMVGSAKGLCTTSVWSDGSDDLRIAAKGETGTNVETVCADGPLAEVDFVINAVLVAKTLASIKAEKVEVLHHGDSPVFFRTADALTAVARIEQSRSVRREVSDAA